MFTPIISGMSFTDIMLYFLLYSIIGYMAEVIFAALVLGKFVNRGFLNGPWCPIYGFGVLIVALTLKPISSSLIMLFIGSMLVTSAIELVTGFVLEKVFHQKWWDYSEDPFNLGGYICLKFSLLWGIACVFVVRLIFPFTDWIASLLRNKLGAVLLFALLALMISDLIVTVVTIAGIKKKLRLMTSIAAKLKENSNNVGGFLSEETLELKKKFDQLVEQMTENSGTRRMMNAFPALKKKNHERLNELRESINESLERSREKSREVRESLAEARENLEKRVEKRTESLRSEGLTKLAITREDIPHIVVTLIIGIAVGYFIGQL